MGDRPGGGRRRFLMFDPDQIGWTEFWLRVALVALSLLVLLLVLMIVSMVTLAIFDLGCWVLRRSGGRSMPEVGEGSVRRMLMNFVPRRKREHAAQLLQALLKSAAKAPDGPVYVSEYDGHPSRVYASPTAAQGACAQLLREEPGDEPHWDWFPDGDGWVMRHVDPTSNEPGPLLGGRVTQTEVEG